MRIQITFCVLLLMLAHKLTCRGKQQNIKVSFSSDGVTEVSGRCVPCTFTDPENKTEGQCTDDCENSNSTHAIAVNELDPSTENCTLTIDWITENDTGHYQFRQQEPPYPPVKITLTVKEEPEISNSSPIDGEQATLSCSAPNPCPSAQPQITWRVKKIGGNFTSLSKGNTTRVTLGNGTITSMVTFTPSIELHDADVKCVVKYGNVTTINMTRTLQVTYLLNPTIKGNVTLKKGATLSLNCSADSYLLPLNISWSFRGAELTIENYTHQDTLSIPNVSSAHVGEYVCTVQHFNKTWTASVNVTLNYSPRILNKSECVQLDEDLECTCISDGLPLPVIVWSHLILISQRHNIQGYINGSIMHSTISLHGHNPQKLPAVVRCLSKNAEGTDERTLNISQKRREPPGKQSDNKKLDLRTILAFFIGAASTAVIVCVVLCCVCMCKRCRTLTATDGNTNNTGIQLEAVKIQHSQADADHIGADEQTPLQTKHSEEAKAAGSSVMEEEDMLGEEGNIEEEETAGEEAAKEVDYACIDYSLLQKRGTEVRRPQSEDTEYAEIQIKKKAEGEGEELSQGGMDQSDSRLEDGVDNQEQEGEKEAEV